MQPNKLPGVKRYRFEFSGPRPEWCVMPQCCVTEVHPGSESIKAHIKGYLNDHGLIGLIELLPDGKVEIEQEWITIPQPPVLTLTELTTARDLVDRKINEYKSNLPRQISKGGSEIVMTDTDKEYIKVWEDRKQRVVAAINLIIESL